MEAAVYQQLRAAVVDAGYEHEVEWAQTVAAPADAVAMWREYAWVVINSGMKNQVAQGIWDRVRPRVEGGHSAHDVFRHEGKAQAIDNFWLARERRFGEFRSLMAWNGPDRIEKLVAWCGRLAWIGPTTKWHLAKNYGVDCAKPDRWLLRVAEASGESVRSLCDRLAAASGDRVATVDLVIWRACNLGLWKP